MSFATREIITIPSPIDVHVHLREPGGEQKETIATGSGAALLGGYQAVFDMPNQPSGMQTWTEERLDQKIQIARKDARTNIGFYAGVDLENPDIDQLHRMFNKAAGLKLYMGHTTGNTKEHDLDIARPAIDEWIRSGKELDVVPPILLHAREEVGEETARYIAENGYPVHWCHVSTVTEANSSRQLTAEYPGLFTAGVTPHHLTMTDRDADFKYGWNGARMMPPLAKEADGDAVLDAFSDGSIQILETDHAPHTPAEKLKAEAANPEGHDGTDCTTCFGISGIEFVLPVMMGLVQRNKITMERLVDSLHYQPASMLGIFKNKNRAETTLEIAPYTIDESDRAGKSSNNPYIGWTGWAQVLEVTIDGVDRLSPGAPKFEPRILRAGSEL